MKAADFDYVRAEDAPDAVRLLAQAPGQARPLAGGQSLGPMLNLRLARPELLVDVSRCEDLRGFTEEDDAVVYGAAITHAEIEDGAVPDASGGWLRHAARRIAYRAVRNRGTVGGSLAHADPAADWLTVLLALAAEVIVLGAHGARAVRLEDFVIGPFTTALSDHEIVTGVRVPKRSSGLCVGYRKLSVKSGEFARAFAVAVRDAQGGRLRAVVGAIEQVPLVLDDVDHLAGDPGAVRALVAERLPRLESATARIHATVLTRALDAVARGESPG